jgi:hypothetical protein
MRPVHIEFARSPRWLVIWIVAGLLLSIVIGLTSAGSRVAHQQAQSILAQAKSLDAEAQALEANRSFALKTAAAGNSSTGLHAISMALRRDLNPAFATAEISTSLVHAWSDSTSTLPRRPSGWNTKSTPWQKLH